MSDNIPLELQVEIMKRVPVKTLLQFRSVSKEWKSVIDSPDFADDYCALQSQPHRLLIGYLPHDTSICNNYRYVSIADDTFPQRQISTTTLPKSVKNLRSSTIVGCSHGLVCFYAYDNKSVTAVLWNPWIRKSVDVPVPNVLFDWYLTILGFGVSPLTKDPTIVKIISSFDASLPIPWRAEVFTLSSRTWKTPSGSINNLPCRNSIIFGCSDVSLDGVIYWKAYERFNVDGEFRHHSLIMSFDLSRERFEEICLPDNLARRNTYSISIFKRMESVVVLEMDSTRTSCGIWMMEQGVTKSFTKLFNVMTQGSSFFVVSGFTKNGEPVVDHGSDALFSYDPYSERIKDLGVVGESLMFSVNSYKETLLLIDQ